MKQVWKQVWKQVRKRGRLQLCLLQSFCFSYRHTHNLVSFLIDFELFCIGLRVYFSNKCTDAVTTPVAPVPIC